MSIDQSRALLILVILVAPVALAYAGRLRGAILRRLR